MVIGPGIVELKEVNGHWAIKMWRVSWKSVAAGYAPYQISRHNSQYFPCKDTAEKFAQQLRDAHTVLGDSEGKHCLVEVTEVK